MSNRKRQSQVQLQVGMLVRVASRAFRGGIGPHCLTARIVAVRGAEVVVHVRNRQTLETVDAIYVRPWKAGEACRAARSSAAA